MSKIMKDLFCWLLLLGMLAGAVACTPQIPPEQQTTEESTTIDGSGTTQDQETTVDTQTEENTTEEVQDVKEQRVIGDRYMIFRIWNFTEQTQAQFQATVDAAAETGFNAINVHIPWSRVEKVAGQYDYTPFDPMIEYVVKTKGLKVAITLDLTRRADDKMIGLDQMQRDPSGNLCKGGSVDGMRTVISFCSESAVSSAVAFYADAVARYDKIYGKDAILYLPTFTQYAETEYWPSGEYDYSDLAKNAFRAFLKEKYTEIAGLNYVLGTTYTDFSQIEPPSCAASDNLGVLWYQFRHNKLKGFIDALADAQKSVAPDTKIALQFGSHFDAAAVYRCTLAAGDLAEKADIVWIDDGPISEHEFSMDYADAMFPSHVELAQEIDGPLQVGATPELYLEQGNDSFSRGCTYLNVANWNIDNDYRTYEWVWKELIATWLGEKTPELVDWNDTSRTMEVKLSQMLRKGNPGTFLTEYYALAPEGEFVSIKVVDDLSAHPVDQPQAIYSFPGAFSNVQGKGNWYYMCTRPKREKFTEMTFDEANGRWQGDSEFALIMKGAIHPHDYDAALVFEAPRDGVIRYTYSLSVSSPSSDGIMYRILKGEEILTTGDKYGYISLPYGEVGQNTVEITVKKGDRIAMIVNVGGTSAHDSTALAVEIEYVE